MKQIYTTLLCLFSMSFLMNADNLKLVAPVAEFSANKTTTCVAEIVTFTDASSNTPISWSWSFSPTTITFENGTDANSENPQVSFNAIGVYAVTLMVTNADGSDSISKSQHIVDASSVPFVEGFESGVPPVGWAVVNLDNSEGWETTTTTGSDGNSTKVVRMDNYQYNSPGQLDDLVMPSIDLSGITNPVLYFDVAYAPYNASNFERLHIEYSTDCGETFSSTTYSKEHLDLATTGYQTNGWGPSAASDWRAESVDLSGYTSTQTIFKFVQTAGYGNGLFIDNVRVETVDPPVAAFDQSAMISCLNEIVTLTDTSLESPTSWAWSFSPTTVTFENGTDANSENPQVSFNAPGNYTITLAATNPNGTDFISKTQYVVDTSSVPFVEGFESGVPPAGWAVVNPDNSEGWETTTTTGSNGNSTKVVRMDNYQYNSAGQLDELVMPSIDISGIANPVLYFDVAYAAYNASNFERLHIEYSTDCGETFNPTTYSKEHLELATTGYQTNGWGPSAASDWRAESMDLSGYSSTQTIFKFIQTAGYGNGLFIDNIRVEQDVTLSNGNQEELPNVVVYPNPSNGKTQIKIADFSSNLRMATFDVQGRIVHEANESNIGANEALTLDLSHLSKGNYFLKLVSDNKTIVKKLVID